MSAPVISLVTLVGALGSALVAGVFFAFSTFVMPALVRLPPEQGSPRCSRSTSRPSTGGSWARCS
jgi:uncharacterized membrane protein